jgi:hypothetical protein
MDVSKLLQKGLVKVDLHSNKLSYIYSMSQTDNTNLEETPVATPEATLETVETPVGETPVATSEVSTPVSQDRPR